MRFCMNVICDLAGLDRLRVQPNDGQVPQPWVAMAVTPGGGGGGKHEGAVHPGGGAQVGGVQVGGGKAAVKLGVRAAPGVPERPAACPIRVSTRHNRPEFSWRAGKAGIVWRSPRGQRPLVVLGADNRWMWGTGDDGRWQYYGTTHVVLRPIVDTSSGGPIIIYNPAANKETLSYTLDGNPQIRTYRRAIAKPLRKIGLG